MGYRKIPNLYKDQTILMFRECYAMEKCHGTSSHIKWDGKKVHYFSGGEKYETFLSLWDDAFLTAKFTELFGEDTITIYGEAYGGKMQGMSHTYGKEPKFIAFEVQCGDSWRDVPIAEAICKQFNIEFVPYCRTSTDVAVLDSLRDAPSEIAVRRGITEPKPREGIVLRPIIECYTHGGECRVICKHKGVAFQERQHQPSVLDVDKQKILEDAEAIADEWVVAERLNHVLNQLGNPTELSDMGKVLAEMVNDIVVEGEGEFVDSKEVRRAISRKTAEMYKARVTKI